MVAQWFYGIGGKQFGPFTEMEIRSLFREGKFGVDDMVWEEGSPQWVRAGDSVLATANVPPARELADAGPFFKIGNRFRVPGGKWIGKTLVSSQAIYLLKSAKDTQGYGAHGGLVGVLLAQAVSSSDDIRTCGFSELPDAVRREFDPKGKIKKAIDVVVLPKDAISRVDLKSFNNLMHVLVGGDKFVAVTPMFKGKLRQFMGSSGWVLNADVTPTAPAIHGQSFGRDPLEKVSKGPGMFLRILYAIVAIAVFCTLMYLKSR